LSSSPSPTYTSTLHDPHNTLARLLSHSRSDIKRFEEFSTLDWGQAYFSARCIKDPGPDCTIMPTQADAGPESIGFEWGGYLQGNTPQVGTGYWVEEYGDIWPSFNDRYNPTTYYSANPYANPHILWWIIETECGCSFDDVEVYVGDGEDDKKSEK